MNKSLPHFQKFTDKPINFKKEKDSLYKTRIYFLPLTIILLFSLLLARLFQLTVVKGSYYRFIAENNRIREIVIEAPRGKILDRKGFTIASSRQKEERAVRIYHDDEALAHLVGYRQLASKEDLKNDLCQEKLKLNDKVGKQGIEKLFECQLRGKKGKKLIEVDAKGKYLKTITVLPPKEGETIRTSIDLELQNPAFDLIKDKKAAIVATKPSTGELLVFTSSPSFDPQVFEGENRDSINQYFADPEKPLFNRASKGTYPPGSLFKLIIAAGALEEKVIDKNFLVEDTGTITAGPLTFGNWYFLQYGKREGMVDITKAIKRSNDIFFYKTGEKLGEGQMKQWAEKFGLGKKTGLPLDEKEGLIPSPFWKKETMGERWYLGDTYNLSIGQGYLLVTPLQVNQVTAAFASGDRLCQPKLLKGEKPTCQSLNLSRKTLDLVREGMKEACSTGGTGWPFFDFNVVVGCKTGTAESHAQSKLPHAWFTVFAPFEKPEIVLTVLVEESGEGSNIAAPIAKEILKGYFERKE